MSQYPNNPYNSPPGSNPGQFRPTQNKPLNPNHPVRTWQMVYVICMLLLYIAVAVGGFALAMFAEEIAANDRQTDPAEMQIMGGIYGVMGLGLSALFAAGLVFRKGMAGWVVNLILIVLGLTSCCTWPATIPLIIYWIKEKDSIIHAK